MFGAHPVSFCALHMKKGFEELPEIDRGLKEFMKQQGYKSLDDFRGMVLKHIASSMSTFEFIPGVTKIDQEKRTGCGIYVLICHICSYYG